jgi:hypothetical protein
MVKILRFFMYCAVWLAVCFPACSCARPERKLDEWRSLAQSETLDVFLKDRIVGTLVHSFAVVDSVNALSVETSLSVLTGQDANGAGGSIELFERRYYNADGSIRTARQTLSGESGKNEWRLEKAAAGWLLTVVAGGIASSVPVSSVKENCLPTLKLYKSIKSSRCKIGDVFRDTAFELVSQKQVAATYRCTSVDPDRKRWTFEVIDDLAARPQTWELDNRARTLSQEIEGVFVARCARKRDNKSQAPRSAAIALSELADIFSVKKDRPPNPKERIVLTLQGGLSPDSSIAGLYEKRGSRWILSGPVQRCESRGPSAADMSFSGSAWTKPTVTIQSDNPAIISLAGRLKSVAGGKDPCGIIDTCNRYVYSTLAKRNAATFSSAVETLKAGFGDCGEHAVLLAAILRAAGIPARVILGLLYYAPKKAFVGHAWVTAYAGGQWIFCDPAFGVFPAATDRVPLIIDDNGAHAVLLTRYIGRIGIEYEKARPDR